MHGPRRKHSVYCSGLFTAPLHSNGRGADHIENTASLCVYRGQVFTEKLLRNGLHKPLVLLLRACTLQALHSGGRCLQSNHLATGLYATIWKERSWANSGYLTGNRFEDQREPTRNLMHDGGWPGQDSNQARPEHKWKELQTEPTCLVIRC
jgi:hypothetical protein